MNIDAYTLFPTLVICVNEFLSKEQCEDIFGYLMKKENRQKLVKHKSIYGDRISFSSHAYHDFNVLENIKKEIESCNDIVNKIEIIINEYNLESGFDALTVANSWYNIQNKGSFLEQHTHPLSNLSGSIYINVDENSSPLVVENPNPFNGVTRKGKTTTQYTFDWHSFQPKIGDLFLFPSWLKHGSHNTQNLTDNRIVISFNTL